MTVRALLLLALLVLAAQAPSARAGPILNAIAAKVSAVVEKIHDKKEEKKGCTICLPQTAPNLVRPSYVCPDGCQLGTYQGQPYCFKKTCTQVVDKYSYHPTTQCSNAPYQAAAVVCPRGCSFSQGACNCGYAPLPCPDGYYTCKYCPAGAPDNCPYSCSSCKNQCPAPPPPPPAPKPVYFVPTPAKPVYVPPTPAPVYVVHVPPTPAPIYVPTPAPIHVKPTPAKPVYHLTHVTPVYTTSSASAWASASASGGTASAVASASSQTIIIGGRRLTGGGKSYYAPTPAYYPPPPPLQYCGNAPPSYKPVYG